MAIREISVGTQVGSSSQYREINLSAHTVCDLIVRLSNNKIQAGPFVKLGIELVDSVPSINYLDGGNVFLYYTRFDFKHFFAASKLERKKLYIEVIKEAFEFLEKKYDIDITLFNDVYQQAVALNFQNHYFIRAAKSSPSRDYKGQVYCEHEEDKFKVYLCVFDKEGKIIVKKFIDSSEPWSGFYGKYFGKTKWKDNRTFCLLSKDGQEECCVKIK